MYLEFVVLIAPHWWLLAPPEALLITQLEHSLCKRLGIVSNLGSFQSLGCCHVYTFVYVHIHSCMYTHLCILNHCSYIILWQRSWILVLYRKSLPALKLWEWWAPWIRMKEDQICRERWWICYTDFSCGPVCSYWIRTGGEIRQASPLAESFFNQNNKGLQSLHGGRRVCLCHRRVGF